ncbi:MAG: hypothetical protein R3A51_10495 [Nannocystaceae bacterium]
MPQTSEETIEQLHRRERDALVQAAKSKTVAIASLAAVGGLVVGIYIGRDVTMRFIQDMFKE